MREVIEWVETKKGVLEGHVLDNGPSLDQLMEEIKNMPIDYTTIKNKDKTEQVLIFYPEHFSEDRGEEFQKEIKEYLLFMGDWEIKPIKDPKGLVLIPRMESEQRL